MSPFLPRHVKEVAAEVPENPDWLVHGLLPLGILALLAAYPKAGKSTLVAQLAVAVAKGETFLDRPTRQGGVLLVIAEERKDDVCRRLRHFRMDEDKGPIYLWAEGVEDTEKAREELQTFIQEKKIALVIIDTFASYLMIKDEIDNSAVTRRLKPYVDMAHTAGATILFVHHERKSREEGDDSIRAIRGGGAISGLADLALQLQKEGGSGTRRRLKMVGRYQEIPPSLTLDYVNDEYVSLGTPEEAGRVAQRGKVLDMLPIGDLGLTTKEVTEKTGLREKAARTALEDAYGLGFAQRSGAGKRGDPFRYVRLLETPATPVASGETKVKEFAEV